MKYQYWKCSICKEEFRTSTQLAKFDVEDHFEKHKKELIEFENANNQYYTELKKLEEKYKKRMLGYWIKNITPPLTPKKLWKCPKCNEKMVYHHKYYHQNNCGEKQRRIKNVKNGERNKNLYSNCG